MVITIMMLKLEEGLNHFMSNIKIDKNTKDKLDRNFFLFLIESLFRKGFITSQECELLRKNGF